jgi:hypothetical protein
LQEIAVQTPVEVKMVVAAGISVTMLTVGMKTETNATKVGARPRTGIGAMETATSKTTQIETSGILIIVRAFKVKSDAAAMKDAKDLAVEMTLIILTPATEVTRIIKAAKAIQLTSDSAVTKDMADVTVLLTMAVSAIEDMLHTTATQATMVMKVTVAMKNTTAGTLLITANSVMKATDITRDTGVMKDIEATRAVEATTSPSMMVSVNEATPLIGDILDIAATKVIAVI